MGIQQSIGYGFSKIGLWHYCTDNSLRFGQKNTCADCSGFISRCLWNGGMAPNAFPQNSADMARWFERNPSHRLSVVQAKHTYGAILVKGGIWGYGPAGHVVFSLGDGYRTLECYGHHGVGVNSINRLVWSHGGLAPVSYLSGQGIPTGPPVDPEVAAVEHGMAVDMIINPMHPTQGYTLDRWGGIHAFGGAKPASIDQATLKAWRGLDIARKIVVANWATGAGYVMDLDGAPHAFNGAAGLSGTPYWKGGKIVPIAEI